MASSLTSSANISLPKNDCAMKLTRKYVFRQPTQPQLLLGWTQQSMTSVMTLLYETADPPWWWLVVACCQWVDFCGLWKLCCGSRLSVQLHHIGFCLHGLGMLPLPTPLLPSHDQAFHHNYWIWNTQFYDLTDMLILLNAVTRITRQTVQPNLPKTITYDLDKTSNENWVGSA